MDLSVQREELFPTATKRYVRVLGRDDTGVIVEPGKNFGPIACFGIHFPKTGECLYVDKTRVTHVKDGTVGL